MLFLTQVNHWKTKRPEKYVSLAGDHGVYTLAYGDYFFLNTNRISDLITLNDGTTQFKYSQAPDDHRCSPDNIETNSSVADIELWHNTVFPSKFVTIPIFPTNDISRVLIDTPINTLIELDDICLAYATPRDIVLNVCHFVYYRNSYKRVSAIANYSFGEVMGALANLTPLLDYDGNIYSTVTIGSQEWIVNNLRTTHYADGTAITNVVVDTFPPANVTGSYCWYNNDINFRDTYGALYNWYAVNNAHGLAVGQFTEGGVLSAGWRVPTVADWTALSTALGGDLVSGGKLKEMGLAHWLPPNLGATDEYGFRAMGNGNRFVDIDAGDGFGSLGIFNDMWTSEAMNAANAYSVYMYNASTDFNHWNHEKYGSMAVRACRDV